MKNTVTPHNSLKKKPEQLDTEENPAKKRIENNRKNGHNLNNLQRAETI